MSIVDWITVQRNTKRIFERPVQVHNTGLVILLEDGIQPMMILNENSFLHRLSLTWLNMEPMVC